MTLHTKINPAFLHHLSQEILDAFLNISLQFNKPVAVIFAQMFDAYLQLFTVATAEAEADEIVIRFEAKAYILADELSYHFHQIIINEKKRHESMHDTMLSLMAQYRKMKKQYPFLSVHFEMAIDQYCSGGKSVEKC